MPDDELRFDELWRSYHPAVLGYACRRAPRALAEEVAAETFAVAWRRIDQMPDDPAPWLIGVARRVLANRRRGDARSGELLARLRREPRATAPDPADLVAADSGLAAALATLPARDRELLALTAWEGLRVSQIAIALGIPAPLASARPGRVRSSEERPRSTRSVPARRAAHRPRRWPWSVLLIRRRPASRVLRSPRG